MERSPPGGFGGPRSVVAGGGRVGEAGRKKCRVFETAPAAEIVATSDVSAEDALNAAKTQAAERPGLDSALAESKSGNAVADIDAHRDGLKKIQDELDAMVSRAEAMRRQAPGATASGDTQLASHANRGATTHRPGEMVDMSQLTAMLTAGGVGAGGGTVGGDGGAGSYRVAPQGSGAEFDLGPESVSIGRGEPFPILPGRRITDEALRHSWLFVGTWYVIGPWDAGNRFNFDIRRPPETAIDLDARYFDGKFADQPGHIDQVLSWRFYQSDRRRCEPPRVYANATWYWFTEVYSDKDRAVIFAIGKDDGGRVWLNDVLISEDSGGGDSTGGLFEEVKGLRRVTLKKGYNKILVRHENGPAFAHQRLIIMSDDAVTVSQN